MTPRVPNAVSGAQGGVARPAAWRAGNTRRRRAATPVLLVAIITAMARAAPGEATRLPDPGDVVSAFMAVRGWVDRFDVPGTEDPASRVALRRAGGVCVILRSSGRVVGIGVDGGGGDLMVRRAAARALGEVLGDPAFASLPPEMAAGAVARLTLELEVAGPPEPLMGDSYEDVARQLEPGLDGVAIRRGEDFAMVFPAQMRAANTAAHVERHLAALPVEIGLAPLPLADLARQFDVSIYRFGATCLAQPLPQEPPVPTFRGETVVADSAVTRRAIDELGRSLAEHLMGTMAPLGEPRGVMGTYRPAPDRYEPLIAPPLEQALAAWALARYGATHGIDGDVAARCLEASDRILLELQEVIEGEADPLASAVTSAAVVLAALERGRELESDEFLAAAAAGARAAYQPGSGFQERDPSVPIPPHGRALVAAALARMLAAGAPDMDARLVRDALDAAWQSVPPHQHVALLPWIGWGESDWARATGGWARAGELIEVRDLVEASRVGTPARPGPPDLAGGFALAQGDRVVATAHSLRPAAYLASMARDPALTPPDEAGAALGRVLKTVRFVMQLSVRPEAAWAYRNPARSAGGIRAATWDSDQPVPAQALGLVFIAETLGSLE